MKKEGIIEFESFEEKAKAKREGTEKKYKSLQERVKELIDGSPTKEAGGEAKKLQQTIKTNPYLEACLQKEKAIITKIRENREEIFDIKKMVSNNRLGIENMFYRFYHESFKAYELQSLTERMVNLFCGIGECHFRDLNPFYIEIVSEGINKKFDTSHNIRWTYETRPILEAFFHSYHLMEMMEKYGLETDPNAPPLGLNEGWASVLYLYNIR